MAELNNLLQMDLVKTSKQHPCTKKICLAIGTLMFFFFGGFSIACWIRLENVITDIKVLQDGNVVDTKIANALDKVVEKLTSDDPKLTKMTNALEKIGKNSDKVLDLLHPGKMDINIEGEENECGTEDVLPIGQKKYFQSPNYPEFYGSDHNCTWCIHVPAEYVVKLEFLEFKTEEKHDYLEIYDGCYDFSRKIGRYSGNELPNKFQSKDNIMRIRFVSDAGNHDSNYRFSALLFASKNPLLLKTSLK